jgi:hypothetical protein
MSVEYVECRTQVELDAALAKPDTIPICRGDGYFAVSSDSATVRASDSATVEAYGSATVRAYGSATVRAYDSATVEASDSATVRASGSATVRASGSATVEASRFVAVTRHGETAKVNGGVLIQIPPTDTPEAWADFYGLKVSRGTVVLFKAVDDEFRSGHGTTYTPGSKPSAPDWQDHDGCGNGLHFCPRPFMAHLYHTNATRFVACRVKLADLVVIGSYPGALPSDKVKAPSCTVLHECDEDGVKLEQTAKAA